MVRPLRIEFPGAVYHVTSRGDRREPIALDGFDRAQFFAVVGQALGRFDADALAYCLMGNHYHLVLRTREANLSRLMRHINGVYTQAFNRRYGIVGHLFQGRFKAILVDTDRYLLEVCRYVDLNPVRAGMVEQVGDYPWSSYRALVGQADAPSWLDAQTLYGQLCPGKSRAHAAKRYAQFVAQGHGVKLWDESLRQQIYLGDDAFINRVQRRAQARTGAARPAKLKRIQASAPPREHRIERYVPKAAQGTSKAERNQAIANAFYKGGHAQTAIAAAFGVSGSTVSRVIQEYENQRLAEKGSGSRKAR
jgi:putative transposase